MYIHIYIYISKERSNKRDTLDFSQSARKSSTGALVCALERQPSVDVRRQSAGPTLDLVLKPEMSTLALPATRYTGTCVA